MGLIIREVIGWVFVALGLVLIWYVLRLALNRSVLEAFALSLPATITFRAGIGLVRLSMAGRIAAGIGKKELSAPTAVRPSQQGYHMR